MSHKYKGHTFLRSNEMNKKLEAHIQVGCLFCNSTPSDIFNYWEIRQNDFPYDAVTKKHDIIYLKRHSKFANEQEKKELGVIMRAIRQFGVYEAQLESLDEQASIPNHYHVHLITFKRRQI